MNATTRNVTVTNFPTHQPEHAWKLIILAEDLNITWNTELGERTVYSDTIDLGTVNINGYSRMMLLLRVTNFTHIGGTGDGGLYHSDRPNRAYIHCFTKSQWRFLEEQIWGAGLSVGWDNKTYYWFSTLFEKQQRMEETISPTMRISVKGNSYTPEDINLPTTVSCLVSIGIYLRNE